MNRRWGAEFKIRINQTNLSLVPWKYLTWYWGKNFKHFELHTGWLFVAIDINIYYTKHA